MTAPPGVEIRCHACGRWIGEAPGPVDLCGLFRHPQDAAIIEAPRLTYQCKSCGWVTVFRLVDRPSWRAVELKGTAR